MIDKKLRFQAAVELTKVLMQNNLPPRQGERVTLSRVLASERGQNKIAKIAVRYVDAIIEEIERRDHETD